MLGMLNGIYDVTLLILCLWILLRFVGSEYFVKNSVPVLSTELRFDIFYFSDFFIKIIIIFLGENSLLISL